jgi:hypothetical protein
VGPDAQCQTTFYCCFQPKTNRKTVSQKGKNFEVGPQHFIGVHPRLAGIGREHAVDVQSASGAVTAASRTPRITSATLLVQRICSGIHMK